MKTIYSVLLALICACTVSAQSFDLKDVLKGIGGSSQSSESSESGKSGSGLGDVLGSVIGNVLGTSKITPADLTGTWNYSAPAVAFKSDDLLKKAGGARCVGNHREQNCSLLQTCRSGQDGVYSQCRQHIHHEI